MTRLVLLLLVAVLVAFETLAVPSTASGQTSPPPPPRPTPVTGGAAAVPEKPRIAIRSPRLAPGLDAGTAPAQYLAILLAEMEASLRATRKFEVLTRQTDTLEDIREEQRFAKSALGKGNAAHEGALESAHYLVVPTIQEFRFVTETRPVPNIASKYTATDKGAVQISAQVVDTTSGQIKTTFKLRGAFTAAPRVVNAPGGIPEAREFTDRIARPVAAQMVEQLIDAVFPMLVLQVVGNQVFINRGEDGGLQPDDVLVVYKPGAQLIDPYTKEVLGSTEVAVGQVRVARVNLKFTIAEILPATVTAPIAREFILRRSSKP
jgi:hypothetical protein